MNEFAYDVMVLLAMLAGTVAAKLLDPLTWALLLVAGTFGVYRFKWWSVFVLCIALSAINVMLIYSWWQEIGIGLDSASILRILAAHLFLGFAAYGAGRFAARFFRPLAKPA